MSISVYRLKQIDDPGLRTIGRREAQVLVAHWPVTSDDNTDYVYVDVDNLADGLEAAAECDGKCRTFEGGKADHDECVVVLGQILPKMLENAQADGNNGWTTQQINW